MANLFGSLVGDRRREIGLTQAGLAARTGCSLSHIIKIENSCGYPSVAVLSRLAEALDCSVGEFFGDRERVPAASRPIGRPAQALR
jgi:transcriptional regulator with XRE-family HTH domain